MVVTNPTFLKQLRILRRQAEDSARAVIHRAEVDSCALVHLHRDLLPSLAIAPGYKHLWRQAGERRQLRAPKHDRIIRAVERRSGGGRHGAAPMDDGWLWPS